jgi:hypothetical protein
MRILCLLASVLALALAGCGSKQIDPAVANAPTTPDKANKLAQAPVTGDLKDKVIGDWTMVGTQGNTKVDAEISIRADGTFTNAGRLGGESPGQDGTVKMAISYSVDGKWTIDGDSVSTTPDKVTAHVDNIEITVKDPANQAAADAQKGELAKQAEEQTQKSLNSPGKTKIEHATADKLNLIAANGVKIEYDRKK